MLSSAKPQQCFTLHSSATHGPCTQLKNAASSGVCSTSYLDRSPSPHPELQPALGWAPPAIWTGVTHYALKCSQLWGMLFRQELLSPPQNAAKAWQCLKPCSHAMHRSCMHELVHLHTCVHARI